MKLENKIKKYIECIKNSDNAIDKQSYLQKLNECKKEIINILCEDNDFLKTYSTPIERSFGILNQDYIDSFYKLYSIKYIYCKLDKNLNTQILDIDFNM